MRAVDLGVRLLENTRVVSLTHAGAWRVATSAGEQQADVGVNGGGAWGWQVAEMVGETWPRTHFAPSMRVTARMSRFLEPVVLGIGRKLSFKQTETGTVVIGDGIPGIPDLDAETADPVAERLPISARTIGLFPIMRNATVIRA